ncbi:DUF6788 family protein [Bdellovibrionota bacterium FG-2]
MIEKRITRIKEELQTIGDMRPGSLNQQYTVCGKTGCRCVDPDNPQKHGPYYQLSYVHNGKSTTQFIGSQSVDKVRQQLENYKIFRALTAEWVDLALQFAKDNLAVEKEALKNAAKRKPATTKKTKSRGSRQS